MQKYKTINTFSQTPSLAQIVSYLIFSTQVIFFSVLIQANYKNQITKIITITLNSIALFSQLLTSFLTSLSDPSDGLMIRLKNQPDKVTNNEVKDVLYCDICQTFVKVSSRHCRICGRCVEGFDHHCIWVNNCVGSRNYKIFVGMICSTFSSMAIYIISVALLWGQNNYNQFLIQMGFIWASGIIIVVFMVLIFNLILFHIYLKYLGIGTFQFLQIERKKQIQNKNIQKRQNTLQNLRNQGQQIVKSEQMKQIKQENKVINLQENIKRLQKKSKSENIMQKNHTICKTEQVKNKIHPTNQPIKIKDNIFEQCSQAIRNQHSQKEQSMVISEHFSRSKSLKFFVSSDATQPKASYLQNIKINVPQGSDNGSMPNTFGTPKRHK